MKNKDDEGVEQNRHSQRVSTLIRTRNTDGFYNNFVRQIVVPSRKLSDTTSHSIKTHTHEHMKKGPNDCRNRRHCIYDEFNDDDKNENPIEMITICIRF